MVALLDNTLRGTCQGCQEIGCRLTFRTLETHVGEVFLGFLGTAEVDLATLIEDRHLVENLLKKN